MTSIDGLIDAVLIFVVTRIALTAVDKWLATDLGMALRVVASILWSAVIIAGFAFLFGNLGCTIAIMSATWHYLLIYAAKNKLPDDKDK